MNLVQASAHRPVAVAVGVLLVLLFGLLALTRIPVQLTPDVVRPVLTVETSWPGVAPTEVEGEITIPLEKLLKAVPGLEKITSSSSFGNSRITLEFRVGTDMNATTVLVSNRLQRISNLPEDANRPMLRTADSDDTPIAFMMLQRLDSKDAREVANELDFVEEVIQPALERVPGVAVVNINGGRKREMRVTVDPLRLAARGLTVDMVAEALRRENADISAGTIDEGKRAYVVRTVGRFSTPEQAAAVLVRTGAGGPVTVGDVAQVGFAYQDVTASSRVMGQPAISINVVREQGANVLEIMAEVRRRLDQLNREVLPPHGLKITLTYDQTDYIVEALALVRDNLWMGGLLAVGVLLYYLRAVAPTVVIALAIPISLVGAFLVMALAGRTVNVISLAGLAFAVGMVVDPAIVALENIFRHYSNGMPREQAAVQGVKEVWGANFVATATTVVVFLPLLSLKIEAVQLFGDIAVALSAAVLFSLVVAVTVIPALSMRLLSRRTPRAAHLAGQDESAAATAPGTAALVALVRRINTSTSHRLAVVGGIMAVSVALTLALLPPAEYLPEGNRNLVSAMLTPPPGYNLAEMTRISGEMERRMAPYYDPNHPQREKIEGPPMRNFFFMIRSNRVFMAAMAEDGTKVRELLPVMKKAVSTIPGTLGVVSQASLFVRGIGRGRGVDLAVVGPELESLLDVARRLFGAIQKAIPGVQVRPVPGLELGNPEVRILPDRLRAAQNGLSALSIGRTVDAFADDGLKVDDLLVEGREMDLVVRGNRQGLAHTQEIHALPLVVGQGQSVPLEAVATPVLTVGPVQIEHVERERAVILQISPPAGMPLESALRTLQQEVIAPMEQAGLPPLTALRFTEGADQLWLAKEAMQGQFLLALAVTYLLMAALYESFLYPLVIITTVPLAAAGGLLGLGALNLALVQPMDVLTMLGFVILVGVVVNNAILIVHQALAFMREGGMPHDDAVAEALRIRVRPILMSTLTSVFGLMPLVLFPGAGSELYRGLGSVLLGGLLFSTVLTLVLIPALLSLVLSIRRGLGWQGV